MDNYQQIYLELAYLVENNQFEKAKEFINTKPIPEINFSDLAHYMKNESFDKLLYIIKQFASYYGTHFEPFYPIMESVNHHRMDIFDYFIEQEAYDDDLINAFICACKHNNNYCIKKLIEKNVLQYYANEWPAMSSLLKHENFEIIDLILNSCKDVNAINFEHSLLEHNLSEGNISEKAYRYISSYIKPESLFIQAVSKDIIYIVQYLINDGLDVSCDHDTALNICAQHGYLSMMELLISHGAGKYDHKEIALSYAVLYPHTQIIKYLLDLDVDYKVAINKAEQETREWMTSYINSKTMATLFEQDLPLKEEEYSKTKL